MCYRLFFFCQTSQRDFVVWCARFTHLPRKVRKNTTNLKKNYGISYDNYVSKEITMSRKTGRKAPFKTRRCFHDLQNPPSDIRTSNPGTVALALKSYGGHRGGGHPSSHRSLLNRRGQNLHTMNSYSTQIQSIL